MLIHSTLQIYFGRFLMERIDIIELIGKDFLTSNIENGEFSYEKALKAIGKNYLDYSSH